MKKLLHFKEPQYYRSYIREYQAQLSSDKKLIIILFLVSFLYSILDIILYISALEKDFDYIDLMIVVIFQCFRVILFFLYLRHCSDQTPQKFLLIERIFSIIYLVAAIVTWNIQLNLDSSRAFIVGLEVAWTLLFINTLFGQWMLRLTFATSVPIFALIRYCITEKHFSMGPIQAGIQVILFFFLVYLDERNKRQRILKGISVEKTEQTLKNILNNLPENIAVLNLEGELIFYNEYLDVSFNISENPVDFFTQIYQIKPRDRNVNLQKIQESYNLRGPAQKNTTAKFMAKLNRQGTLPKTPNNGHLRRYLTEDFNLTNKLNGLLRGGSPKGAKKQSTYISRLTPSKTLTEFFASIKYFNDLQEVLDFFCVNIDMMKNYSQKEKTFFLFDGKYKTADGFIKSFEIKIALSNFNAEDGFVIILRDTTHRDILVTLEDHNQFKDSVLASISHELRTPLNTNLNLLELAISKFSSPEDLKASDRSSSNENPSSLKDSFLVPAHKSGKLLESVINDVLDYSMLIARKFVINIKEQYLLKSLEKIRYACEFQARQRNIEFHISLSQKLNYKVGTDHRRLRQILINLTNNAIRFTTRGYVSVRIEPYNDNPDLIQFIVKDSGVGIAPEVKDRMTAMLEKGNIMNKLNKDASGVGLGLTISHLLAKELGPPFGRLSGIKIESEENHGSKFSFLVENWSRSNDQINSHTKTSELQKHRSGADASGKSEQTSFVEPAVNPDTNRMRPLKLVTNPPSFEELEHRIGTREFKNSRGPGTPESCSADQDAILLQQEEMDDQIACMIKNDNLRMNQNMDAHLLKSELRFPILPTQPSVVYSTKGADLGSADVHSALLNEQRKGKSEFPLLVTTVAENIDIDVARSHSAGALRRQSEIQIMKNCVCSEILVVDDDMFNLFTMESLVGNFGSKILKALNGKESIDAVKKRCEFKCSATCSPLKLIIMDLSMPVMDGFQATIALKEMMKNGEIPYIPIVACTAFVDKENTEKCYTVGMEGRISKPVNKNKLKETLKQYGILPDKIEEVGSLRK